MRQLCQTLSNAFDISKNTPIVSVEGFAQGFCEFHGLLQEVG